VFVACGTGEFSALDLGEYAEVVQSAVEAVTGRVPVFAGAGRLRPPGAPVSPTGAKDAGADGILLLPPYLTLGERGTASSATCARPPGRDLPRHRLQTGQNARFDEHSAAAAAELPQVIGFKDGAGDLDLMSRIVRAVRE